LFGLGQTNPDTFSLTPPTFISYPNFVRTKLAEQLPGISMRFIAAHAGQIVDATRPDDRAGRPTGLAALDAIAPPGGLAVGAIHELLARPDYRIPGQVALAFLQGFVFSRAEPAAARSSTQDFASAQGADEDLFGPGEVRNAEWGMRDDPADLSASPHSAFPIPHSALAQSVLGNRQSAMTAMTVAWLDPDRRLYPPALSAAGISTSRLLIVRPPADDRDALLWAANECLRSPAIAATVARPPAHLSRVEARRLQLSAEAGGGIGLLLRPLDRGRAGSRPPKASAQTYAAATRWLIEPARGERRIRRWKVELLHGHGGHIGRHVWLELTRDHDDPHHLLRTTDQLAHRPTAAPAPPLPAGDSYTFVRAG
jgi:hypothetical protein